MPRFLTIDLGTTLFKFAIFDDHGSLLALARIKPPIEHPQPGHWELNVAKFRDTIRSGIAELKLKIGSDDIAAISFASQANSFVLLDSNDSPLSPLILWPDERAKAYEDDMQRASSVPGFRHETGIPRLGHQFAAGKLLRWQKENAEIFQHSPRLLFICDLVTFWFTRQHATEAGIAGLSGALNIHPLTWRENALSQLGFDNLTLPSVVRPGTDLGEIDPATADEFGLPRRCRFVMGCLDQYASAIGTGTVVPGSVCETTGTVLATVRCTETIRDDAPADVFAGPSFDDKLFFEMSFSSTSANLLEHYRNSLEDHPEFADLIALAEQTRTSDLLIEPSVDGQSIESCFANVKPHHTRGQIVLAIMEVVARQLDAQVRALCNRSLPSHIVSAGGGARSSLWLTIKARTLGVPFMTTGCEEPTSLGAAMLAAHALTHQPICTLAKQWVHPRSPVASTHP